VQDYDEIIVKLTVRKLFTIKKSLT
jgi:hypothetical protein